MALAGTDAVCIENMGGGDTHTSEQSKLCALTELDSKCFGRKRTAVMKMNPMTPSSPCATITQNDETIKQLNN